MVLAATNESTRVFGDILPKSIGLHKGLSHIWNGIQTHANNAIYEAGRIVRWTYIDLEQAIRHAPHDLIKSISKLNLSEFAYIGGRVVGPAATLAANLFLFNPEIVGAQGPTKNPTPVQLQDRDFCPMPRIGSNGLIEIKVGDAWTDNLGKKWRVLAAGYSKHIKGYNKHYGDNTVICFLLGDRNILAAVNQDGFTTNTWETDGGTFRDEEMSFFSQTKAVKYYSNGSHIMSEKIEGIDHAGSDYTGPTPPSNNKPNPSNMPSSLTPPPIPRQPTIAGSSTPSLVQVVQPKGSPTPVRGTPTSSEPSSSGKTENQQLVPTRTPNSEGKSSSPIAIDFGTVALLGGGSIGGLFGLVTLTKYGFNRFKKWRTDRAVLKESLEIQEKGGSRLRDYERERIASRARELEEKRRADEAAKQLADDLDLLQQGADHHSYQKAKRTLAVWDLQKLARDFDAVRDILDRDKAARIERRRGKIK